MTVDWTKPIEAYHEDGRVEPAKHIGNDGLVYCSATSDDGKWYYGADGEFSWSGWRIRNVVEEIPDWAIERAVDPVRHLLNKTNEPSWMPKEIRRGANDSAYCRIALELARYIAQHEDAPVDPLVAEAEKMAGEWYSDIYPHIDPMLAAIRRGIEIGKSHKKGPV